jgi:hypothetical protein
MFDRIAEWTLEYSRQLIVATVLIALACASTLPLLEFNFTPQQLFESTARYDRLREQIAEQFGREDNLMTVLVNAPDVLTPEVLTYTHRLTIALEEVDRTNRTSSVTTFEVPRSADGALSTRPILQERLEARDLVWRDPGVTVTREDADALAALVAAEPLLDGSLVSSDRELLAVLVWIDDEVQDATDLEAIAADVDAILAANPPPDGVRIRTGGIPRVRVDVVGSLRTEQLTFIPIVSLIFFFILTYLFRRPSGVILPLAVVACAVAATIALMVVTGFGINIINNVLPILVFVIGISDSVHMLTRQAEEMEEGRDAVDAAKEMVRRTGAACLLTSTTTAVGFASLIVADTDILKAFGWQAAAGVMFAYAFTLISLPAALAHMRPVSRRVSRSGAHVDPTRPDSIADAPLLERFMVALAHRVLGHPKLTLLIGGAITVGLVVLASSVRIDTTLLEIYKPDHPTFQTTKELEAKLGGILPVEISISHPDVDHFKDPEVYANLAQMQEFALAQSEVLSTQSLVDFHQAARVALIGDPAQRDVMPTSRAQIEQLHLLIEGPPDQLGGVRSYMTTSFDNARLLLRVRDSGAKKMIALGDTLEAELARRFPASAGYEVIIAGDAYVASVALDSFVRDLFASLLLAIVIIFGMMTVVFRSLKVGLISVVPNLTPLLLTFAYMGYEGITLNTTTIIIFAISLGLAVDDTIHFLARYREESARRANTYDALIHTYFGAGRAIMLTSVLLLVGMGVLLFSDFQPTNYFGSLTGITIAGAVFGDLILLPPLLLLVDGRKDSPHPAAGDASPAGEEE